MQILTSAKAPQYATTRPRTAVTSEATPSSGDSVTLGVLQTKPSPRPGAPINSNKWKAAVIGAAAGAVLGAVGGAIGGSVGSVAVAPVVAFMGGAAAASAFKFRGTKAGTDTSAEMRSVMVRVASAGLAGAAVVALGAHGGWVGAAAAGLGGLVTGGALGLGLGG